ncbi:unnamed protein product [Mesocestoides corti]|uniref:Secreted protein n=1 Tax=Mesocestoides corti TaxID=53468 RepID=A0A0R3UMW7_MESCO|nr:unnamed protein product [Mesocestoides corti]
MLDSTSRLITLLLCLLLLLPLLYPLPRGQMINDRHSRARLRTPRAHVERTRSLAYSVMSCDRRRIIACAHTKSKQLVTLLLLLVALPGV